MAHLLQESYASTRSLLARNLPLLDALTQRLLAHNATPVNGNGSPVNGNGSTAGAGVWRSDGVAGTLFGSEVRCAVLCLLLLPDQQLCFAQPCALDS